MHKLVKQISTAAVFATVASTAHADITDAQVRNLENRVSALEQRKGASGMINPSGRPEVKDGADIFITGDLLIWQSHVNGLGYVIKNRGAGLSDSSTKELHYNWDPGFRVGFGWNTPHDGWDLFANWTSYHNKATSYVSTGSSSFLYPSLAAPAFSLLAPTSARAHWRLNLNMVDLELGREFFVSKWLTLRPFVGMRSAWIHQRMNVAYNQPAADEVFYVNMKNKYWGIGVRPGLNTQWGLGCGFSFYGNTSLSLLYGFFDLDQDQYSVTSVSIVDPDIDNDHSFRVGRAIAEIQLGIRWEHMLANDHLHFSIQTGWENLMFFGQNQFDRFVNATTIGTFVSNQGDLTIQGYTLSMRMDF